jgi:hypothetical protein
MLERPVVQRARAFRLVGRVGSGVKSVELWACHRCAALIVPDGCVRHLGWHRRVDEGVFDAES